MQTDGISGFFVGFYATLVRDVPYTMLELGLYENIKDFMKKRKLRNYPHESRLTFKEELFAAAVAGGISALVTTPFDLVKTKLMLAVSFVTVNMYFFLTHFIYYIVGARR
jgi:solute carrier family 25 S-adenosylmethionine transporter 26